MISFKILYKSETRNYDFKYKILYRRNIIKYWTRFSREKENRTRATRVAR